MPFFLNALKGMINFACLVIPPAQVATHINFTTVDQSVTSQVTNTHACMMQTLHTNSLIPIGPWRYNFAS